VAGLHGKKRQLFSLKARTVFEAIDSDRGYLALYDALNKGWDAMKQSLIDGLIKSMDSRVKAVIAAKGWYTRYRGRLFFFENQYESQARSINNNLTNFERKPRNFEGVVII
jgi:hypothetical protein